MCWLKTGKHGNYARKLLKVPELSKKIYSTRFKAFSSFFHTSAVVSRVVTNPYTLGHFLAHFTQTCSIMRADGKFLAIIPCMLGLLPENVKDLP